MKKRQLNNKGFGAIGVLAIVVVLALVGGAGVYVWHHNHDKKTSTTASSTTGSTSTTGTTKPAPTPDPYAGWKPYTNPGKTYSLKYPNAWQTFNNGETPKVSVDLEGFGPQSNSTLVSVASTKSTEAPRAYILSRDQTPNTITEKNLTIGGYPAYYQESGDSTYTDLIYAISHDGLIVTVTMIEKAQNPTVDNTAFANQFDLLAKSVTITQ